jgi:hypothetical protein
MKTTKLKTGVQILNQFGQAIMKTDPSLMDKIQVQATNAQIAIHDIHARAMGCHCECMGMNADNCNAATNGQPAPYGQHEFAEVMQKWGMVDESNKPII